jgi:hypothetical protein
VLTQDAWRENALRFRQTSTQIWICSLRTVFASWILVWKERLAGKTVVPVAETAKVQSSPIVEHRRASRLSFGPIGRTDSG